MDVVHHGLVGLVGFQVVSANMDFPEAAAFLLGSIFPDLDVVLMVFGKRFYLKNHQALSHSLPLSPVYAILLSAPFFLLEGISLGVFFAALLGLWIHIALDWCNTYRIAPFSPFSYRRFSLDATFFIDSVTLLLTVTYLIYTNVVNSDSHTAGLYATLFILYVLVKWRLQYAVKSTTNAEIAIPASFNPFAFYLYHEDDRGYHSCLYNFVNRRRSKGLFYPRQDSEILALASRSRLFRDMENICRALRIVEVVHDERGTSIIARDLAVRNFGGQFGKTILRYNNKGELIDEMANI